MASPAPDTVWLLDQAPLVAEEGKLRLGRDSLVIRNTALSIEDCTVGKTTDSQGDLTNWV